MFRRIILPFLLLLLCLMVDISVIPMIPIPILQTYAPLFSLMTVVVFGLLLGRTRGLLYGLIGGILMDVLVSTPLGLMASIFIGCGYIAGVARRQYEDYAITPMVTSIICFVLYELVMLIFLYLASARIDLMVVQGALIRIPIEVFLSQLMYLLYDKLLQSAWSRYTRR